MRVLIFELESRRFALPQPQVQEVVRAVLITPLPSAPAVVEGVINFRGSLVPVFDIRRRFGLALRTVSASDHLIVAWAGTRRVAIRVDRAVDLVEMQASDIEDARSAVPQSEYVSGVAKLEDGLVLIHDLASFLSAAEAETLAEALALAGSGAGQAS